ncbi:MAG: LamG-like jellyroll fold domain-containing protein [Lacunisphaera sp.]
MKIPRRFLSSLCVTMLLATVARSAPPVPPVVDPRNITSGSIIPSEGYSDQPYIVQTDDGAWLCIVTTGKGVEGAKGQHVVSLRSTDLGKTWEDIVPIEPADGPEASYGVLLKVPGGRVYAFYNHNTDRVTEIKREDGGAPFKRVDCLGHYVFKYSDDNGRTWSAQRYDIPVREFECDRTNVYGGKLTFFWNVGRPIIVGHAAFLTLHKVGAMGAGFYAESEGALLTSRNILTERDPTRITFDTLPDGDIGLRAPAGGGRVAEEQNIVSLSDESLFCVYRTVAGWPAMGYSRDHGHTWTAPAYLTYTPGGSRVKHPRAANFVWKASNGKFLYWFHNQGGPVIGKMAADYSGSAGSPYDDRNPAWLMAGTEKDTPQGKVIVWSQPEIILYDDDTYIRMSYPNLVEQDGHFYVTETQKNLGRVHEIPAAIIGGLFQQPDNHTVASADLALDLPAGQPLPATAAMPVLLPFQLRDNTRADYGSKDMRAGFSLDFWFKLDSLAPHQALLDSRDANGKGILVATTEAGTIRVTLNDGRAESSWTCDPGVLHAGKKQHMVITVDGGPKIITFVVDGVLNDGGDARQFGWGRFSPTLRAPNGAPQVKLAPSLLSLRVYLRALRTSEAVGNYQHGL